MNPLYKVAEMALATIERCEKQLGIGASNRASLGIAIASETKSLSDLNKQYDEPPAPVEHPAGPVEQSAEPADEQEAVSVDHDQAANQEDPRLAVVDAATGKITQRKPRSRRSVS